MRYFIDTEFIERGHEHPIELISLAIVREDGKSEYMVASDGWSHEHANAWVKENVIAKLDPSAPRYTRQSMADTLKSFVYGDADIRFYGWYADYDWVVLCQLFGAMIDLPEGFPMFCRDVKQIHVMMGSPELPKQDPSSEHDALADAFDVKAKFEFLSRLLAAKNITSENL